MNYFNKYQLYKLLIAALIGMVLGGTGGFIFNLIFFGLSGSGGLFWQIIYQVIFFYVLLQFALAGIITALLTKILPFKPFYTGLAGAVISLILNLYLAFSLPVAVGISTVANQIYIFEFLISPESTSIHIFTFILGLVIGISVPILTARIATDETDMP